MDAIVYMFQNNNNTQASYPLDRKYVTYNDVILIKKKTIDYSQFNPRKRQIKTLDSQNAVNPFERIIDNPDSILYIKIIKIKMKYVYRN